MDVTKIGAAIVGLFASVVVVCLFSSLIDAWIWNSVDFLEGIRHLAWHEIFRVKLLVSSVAGLFKLNIFTK